MAKNDLLIAWLNDAYAMESSKTEMLERFASDFGEFSDIEDRLRDYVSDAKKHQEDVQTCIESLEGKVSAAKSFLGTVMGTAQGIGTSMYKDESVKDMLMIHAGAHFAHACYLSLASGATALGADTVASACETIAAEELKLAEWAEEQIPTVTNAVLLSQNEQG